MSSRKRKIHFKLSKKNIEVDKEEEKKSDDKPTNDSIEYEDDYLEREDRLRMDDQSEFFEEADNIVEENGFQKAEDTIVKYSWPKNASEHEIIYEKGKMDIEDKPNPEITEPNV